MKYYDYSVKDLLTKKFGPDTLLNMRKKRNGTAFDDYNNNSESREALLWQRIDQSALGYFLEDIFYDYTELNDDYIVYFGHSSNHKYAIVTFAHGGDHKLEDLPTEYAYEVCQKYKKVADRVWLLQQTPIHAYYVNNGYYTGSGYVSIPEKHGDDYILRYQLNDEWQKYFYRFLTGVRSVYKKTWEILFDKDVKVTYEGNTLANNLEELFDKWAGIKEKYGNPMYILLRTCLKYKSTMKGMTYDKPYYVYSNTIGNEKYSYDFFVNKYNQVSKIEISKVSDKVIIVDSCDNVKQGLHVPKLLKVTPLDFNELQTYCFEAVYEDSIRIFYFDRAESADKFMYEGKQYGAKILETIKITEDGEGVFFGDAVIPAHIVYVKSLRQLYPIKFNETVYEDKELLIKKVYQEPLRMSWRKGNRYKGDDYEIFGPNNCFIGEDGDRKSKISFTDKTKERNIIKAIVPEYTDLYGLINEKMEWTETPQFKELSEYYEGCCIAYTDSDNIFINDDGKAVHTLKNIPISLFECELCPVSIKDEQDKDYPDPHPFWDNRDFEYHPGLYGYINTKGDMVIEPQYLYATSFYETDGGHAFVAKLIDGQIRWGLIDYTGKELIPCQYAQLSYAYEDGIAYYSDDGKCGLMDYDGTIITPPLFSRIPDYHQKNNMITFTDDEDNWGVYDCTTQKVILEAEYEYIDISDDYLEVEGEKEDGFYGYTYFDLAGNPIEYPHKGPNWREKEIVDINVLKEHPWFDFKGLCDSNNNIIIPPVYSTIRYVDGLIIASERTDTNWRYRETIFKADGTVVLKGSFKEFDFDNTFMKVKTPEGLVTYKIIMK